METTSTPRRSQRDIVGALLLIAFGGILLLNNLNLVPWSVWGELWRFWPVILVLIGFQMVLGSSWVGEIVMFLLGAAVILLVVLSVISVQSGQANRLFGGRLSLPRLELPAPFRFDL